MNTLCLENEPWLQVPTSEADHIAALPLLDPKYAASVERDIRKATGRTGWRICGFIPGKGLVAYRDGRMEHDQYFMRWWTRYWVTYDPKTNFAFDHVSDHSYSGHHQGPEYSGTMRREWRKYLLPKSGRSFYADCPQGVSVTVVENGQSATVSTTPVTVYDALNSLPTTEEVESHE